VHVAPAHTHAHCTPESYSSQTDALWSVQRCTHVSALRNGVHRDARVLHGNRQQGCRAGVRWAARGCTLAHVISPLLVRKYTSPVGQSADAHVASAPQQPPLSPQTSQLAAIWPHLEVGATPSMPLQPALGSSSVSKSWDLQYQNPACATNTPAIRQRRLPCLESSQDRQRETEWRVIYTSTAEKLQQRSRHLPRWAGETSRQRRKQDTCAQARRQPEPVRTCQSVPEEMRRAGQLGGVLPAGSAFCCAAGA
jgi:hypothetical protein